MNDTIIVQNLKYFTIKHVFSMDFVLDEKDKRILAILKDDARKSFTDVATKMNLSEGAVRKRVKSLVKNKIIRRFTIEASEELYPVRSIVMIKLSPKAPFNKILEYIKKMSGLYAVHPITGNFDIFVDIGSTNTSDLQGKMIHLRNQRGVASTLTMEILS